MSNERSTGKDITTKFKKIKEDYKVPFEKQGITKSDVELVLKSIKMDNSKQINCIWALLDDELESIFDNNFKFSDGATTAHIGAYIGVLLGDADIKTDREYIRDYYIKPLLEIGAIEPIIYLKKSNKKVNVPETGFYIGHLVPKSGGNCYRLNVNFIELLKSFSEIGIDTAIQDWIEEDSKNKRLQILADATRDNTSRYILDGHGALISKSINIYAKHFLEGYEVIYTDAIDGERITEGEQNKLDKYGIIFGGLDSVWPDAILYNENLNSLWFIEAVTSDGEVDLSKVKGYKKICEDSKKIFGGSTTAYPDYKTFAARQEKFNNLAEYSYVWIESKPNKIYQVK